MSTVSEAVLVLFGGYSIFVVLFHKSIKPAFINETFRDALIKLLVNYSCLMGQNHVSLKQRNKNTGRTNRESHCYFINLFEEYPSIQYSVSTCSWHCYFSFSIFTQQHGMIKDNMIINDKV